MAQAALSKRLARCVESALHHLGSQTPVISTGHGAIPAPPAADAARGYRPGKRPLMRRNAGARRERRTRCVDRRGCACRPPQRSSPCGRRPQRPSRTGQQPAKQRRQSCAIAGISQRRLRARERQAGARACRRPGGRARRGLAPSSRQPAPDAERGPRSHPRALCVAYQAPSPRVPPVHGRSGRAGGWQSAAGPCRLSLCASAAGAPPRRRARRLSA